MKCPKATKAVKTEKVAPFAGAWIEMRKGIKGLFAPYLSLPSRERGLKSVLVAVGIMVSGRSLRGSVD